MRIEEILGFATSRPKKQTVKRRPRQDDDEPLAIKLQKRREAAAKGDKDAFTHNFKKASK